MSEPSTDVIIADYKKENEELRQTVKILTSALTESIDKANDLEDEVGALTERVVELEYRLECLSK